MKKTFIFDYDDTLAPNHFHYEDAKIEFVRYISRIFYPHVPEIANVLIIQQKLDRELVGKYGFKRERFPTSLVETYKSLCAYADRKPSHNDMAAIYSIGLAAFDKSGFRSAGLMPRTEETLDFLAANHDELILLTKGDVRVQRSKLDATGVAKWFSEIYITPHKDANIILNVVGDRDKSKVWHVGNLIKSDVDPAIDAGIKAIYIPLETWSYEAQHQGLRKDPNLTVFSSIIEIKNNYNTLT